MFTKDMQYLVIGRVNSLDRYVVTGFGMIPGK